MKTVGDWTVFIVGCTATYALTGFILGYAFPDTLELRMKKCLAAHAMPLVSNGSRVFCLNTKNYILWEEK